MHTLPTHCRARLDRRDFAFISEILTGDRAGQLEALLALDDDMDSLDALLTQPRLIHAVLTAGYPVQISAELYFYVLVRHSLKEAGIDRAEVADYVAATLAEYAKGNPFRSQGGKPDADFTYHIDFIEALNDASHRDRFYLHVQCGNQFLVLTGLFPRFLEHRNRRRGAPNVAYYEGVARESFRSAAGHPLADKYELSEVYLTLSEQFGQTRRALNHLTREYLFLGA